MPGELAYDLSSRTLADQQAVLAELRARTGVLLAATAFLASFLGGRALDEGTRWLAIPGLGLALVTLALAVYQPRAVVGGGRVRLIAMPNMRLKPPPAPPPPGIFAPETRAGNNSEKK